MDWVDLICGSEGTLGVITEARVGLLPTPEGDARRRHFLRQRRRRAGRGRRLARRLRMLEYMDANSIEVLRARYPEMPKEAAAVLLIEQELESEDDPEVDVWIERIEGSGALAEASWFATTAADRERFRKFRHTLPELVNDTVRRSGALKMNTDYAVPLARNREMLAVLPRSGWRTDFRGGT